MGFFEWIIFIFVLGIVTISTKFNFIVHLPRRLSLSNCVYFMTAIFQTENGFFYRKVVGTQQTMCRGKLDIL